MKDFNLATLIVGLLSLSGVIVNIFVTMIADKKRRYTSLITSHRISSMKAAETLFSKIIGCMYNFRIPSTDKVSEFKNFELNKQEVLYLIGQDGSPEAEIRQVLGIVDHFLFFYSVDKTALSKKQIHKFYEVLKTAIDCLQNLTRAYAKCEWEKCKHASSYGNEKKFDNEKVLNNFYINNKENVEEQIKFLQENDFQSILDMK